MQADEVQNAKEPIAAQIDLPGQTLNAARQVALQDLQKRSNQSGSIARPGENNLLSLEGETKQVGDAIRVISLILRFVTKFAIKVLLEHIADEWRGASLASNDVAKNPQALLFGIQFDVGRQTIRLPAIRPTFRSSS